MTRIKRLELIAFGRFKNKTIELSGGLDFICGLNEAGKSTVRLFIKSMLYGAGGGRGRGAKLRERMIPWGESRASGRMIIEKDGVPLEIYREFGSRPSEDVTKVTAADGTDWFGAPVSGAEVGERLLGMSEDMFSRTVFIAQDGAALSGGSEEIEARLTNLMAGGSETVSAAAAEERLKKRIASLKAKDRRAAPGEIDKLEAERRDLAEKLRGQEKTRNEAARLRAEITALEAEAAEAEKETARLRALELSEAAKEKTERLKQLDACLAEEIQLGNSRRFQLFKHKIKDDTSDKIHGLSDRIDEIESGAYRLGDERDSCARMAEEAAKREKLFLAIGIVLAAVGFCCAVLGVIFKTYDLLSGAALIIISPIGYLITRRRRARAIELLGETDGKIADTRKRVSELETELSEALNDLECDTVRDFDKKYADYRAAEAKIETVRGIYDNILGGGDYAQIKAEADEARKYIIKETPPANIDPRRAAAEAERRHTEAVKKITELKIAEGRLPETVLISDIENNIKLIDEKLAEKRGELEALGMALEGVRDAERHVRSDYAPLLNERAGEILAELTDGRRGEIMVAADFSVKLKDENAPDAKRAELFSAGTYTQVYLAVRLAVAELVQKAEDTIVFLDDVLTGFDDERAYNAALMLKKRCGDKRQALLFSCHGRERQNAEKIGGINIIEIDDQKRR